MPLEQFLMNMCSLICPGADDVFIIYDIWMKFKEDGGGDIDMVELTSRTLRHGGLSVLVTSLTTSAALFANYYSDITAIQTFGLFAGLCILANFVFMITWVPPVIVLMEKVDARCCTSCSWKRYKNATEKMSQLSFYIWGTIAPIIINKLYILWIITFLALGVGSFIVIFVTPQLRLPTTEMIHFLYEDHLLERYNWEYKDHFRFQIAGNAEDFINVRWLFGLDGRDKGNHLDPDDLGSLTFLDDFSLYTPVAQQWMLEFCENLKKESYISKEENYMCLFTRFKELLEGSCEFVKPNVSDHCCNKSFPVDSSTAELCLTDPDFLTMVTSTGSLLLGTLFYDQSKLSAVRYDTMTNLQFTFEYDEMASIYKIFSSFLSSQMEGAPDELGEAGFTSDQFWYYDLQKALAEGTYYGILLSLSIGVPVLLVTSLNIVITLYAVVTIIFVIAATIAAVVLMGWELNGGEALTITLAVGLSIDFTIHFGVAFKLSKKSTREHRVVETMALVGSAVSMAALTTFASGASLLQGRILSYKRFGIFLMMVMVMSWLYSNFFFMSVCRLMGPLRRIGDITACCRKKKTDDDNVPESKVVDAPSETNVVQTTELKQVASSNSSFTMLEYSVSRPGSQAELVKHEVHQKPNGMCNFALDSSNDQILENHLVYYDGSEWSWNKNK